MKTLPTTLPGLLSDVARDRPAPVEVPEALSAEPDTNEHHELSEYELEHNDLERFDLEDEVWQVELDREELAEPYDGRLEDDGFWTRTWPTASTRTKLMGSEVGMATAEYAIATLAAVGLAGLLVVILRSEEVRGFLLNLIRTALSLP
ncbi:hypothetical protein CQ020_19270 [Arthrobacter sp. MYb23]|uniref:DUF4244 domain-containing protein n=1 Tax=unclassified Arthrobacter TaxID=235627 RepID=UPI000CFB4C6B|nr:MULTISPECIES: DUF4244 domain-containing protein [unclassified Arthrobacter]PRB44863.1 hypothetical protein CQ038_00220 [Arthrobacter sp. MYb51]PRB93133.1 hypothetical protein CQ020_19270 [Arthrobacter sp. MYb23]